MYISGVVVSLRFDTEFNKILIRKQILFFISFVVVPGMILNDWRTNDRTCFLYEVMCVCFKTLKYVRSFLLLSVNIFVLLNLKFNQLLNRVLLPNCNWLRQGFPSPTWRYSLLLSFGSRIRFVLELDSIAKPQSKLFGC